MTSDTDSDDNLPNQSTNPAATGTSFTTRTPFTIPFQYDTDVDRLTSLLLYAVARAFGMSNDEAACVADLIDGRPEDLSAVMPT